MGRWAQYRTRGRGQVGGASFPLEAPVDGNWHPTNPDTGELGAEMDTGCPGGADGMFSRWRLQGTEEWTEVDTQIDCGGSLTIATGLDPETYDVQVAWEVDGVTRISDWSTTRTVAVS